MSQLLNVNRILLLVLVTTTAPVLHANPPTASSFSDEALKQAGWSIEQIAELRAQTKQPAPENASEKLSDFSYSSIFKDYTPHDYLPDLDWSSANEKVREIGGWRSYARQVQEARRAERENEGDKK